MLSFELGVKIRWDFSGAESGDRMHDENLVSLYHFLGCTYAIVC